MTITALRSHYGFSRMPFGKDLAPGMLNGHRCHAEAVARIAWCIDESAIGVITGECGSGKTVAARAAVAGSTRHGTPCCIWAPPASVCAAYTAPSWPAWAGCPGFITPL